MLKRNEPVMGLPSSILRSTSANMVLGMFFPVLILVILGFVPEGWYAAS